MRQKHPMQVPASPAVPPIPPSGRLPDELLDRLHGADQRLHESRAHLEAAFDEHAFRHEERIHSATDELRQPQREWEDVDQKVRNALHNPA